MNDILYFMLQQDQTWPLVASIIYTAAWCASFYGQIYEHYKKKTVEGLSMDYLAFNITGYTLYTIYSTFGYFTDLQGAGTVVIADLVFVYHTMLMMVINIAQCWIYSKGKTVMSKQALMIAITIWIFVAVEAVCTRFGFIEWYEYWNPLSAMGYGKLALSLFKCTPQIYWNYKRKSTRGWSIAMIWLDLIGAAFSMASGGLSLENGLNITKVALGFLSVFYDLIFCLQHYVLYRKATQIIENNEKEKQNQSLLTK